MESILSRREFLERSFQLGALAAASSFPLVRTAWALDEDADVADATSSQARIKNPNTIRLAFGSCNSQWRSQNYFRTIGQDAPDVWIWLGDTVYTDLYPNAWRRAAFDSIKRNRAYTRFRRNTTILGTWDDHDYGRNNCGVEFSDKSRSREILLDFLDEPKNSPRRNQCGVYSSHILDKAGLRIKLILLDERSFREKPGKNSVLLGSTQWDWLDRELSEKNLDCMIIGSSSQALSISPSGDNLASFTNEFGKLLEILHSVKTPTFFISGDRHFAEVSRIRFQGSSVFGGYLYDFTSSGLTHFDRLGGQDNQNSTHFYRGKNYGLISLSKSKSQQVIVQFQAKDPQTGAVVLDTQQLFAG